MYPESKPTPHRIEDLPHRAYRSAARVLQYLREYHQHEVKGLESIPSSGGFLLAFNHSLATYDGALLVVAIYEQTGHIATALGDNLIFKIPGLRNLAPQMGIYPASHENGSRLLAQEHMVAVAPGGMREALRPSHEKFQVRWQKRKGFIRLSLMTGAPILLAACPSADELYTVHPSPMTRLAYRYLKIPLPIFSGVYHSPIPYPVRLVHHLSTPIQPPALIPGYLDQQIEEFHGEILEKMHHLMQVGVRESQPERAGGLVG